MSIDQSVEELELPSRRRFLSLGASLVIGGAVYATLRAFGVVHPSEAYAQDESVEDILKGSPFRDLDINRYWEEVGQGNVFVMIYRADAGGSIGLAKAMKEVSKRYANNVVFLKYKDDNKKDEWLALGIDIWKVPAWLMYVDGKEKFRKEKSPIDQQEDINKFVRLMENKFRQVYQL